MAWNPIIVQALYYGAVLVLGFFLVNFIQRGFFLKFLRVRMSLGRLVLIKIREVNRDLYATGEIIEGFLVFKQKTAGGKKETKRVSIPKDKAIFYRTIGITMVDIDSERNSFCTIDYEAADGFDAVKFQDLYLRALYKPALLDANQKLIIVLIAVNMLLVIGCLYMEYRNGKAILNLHQAFSIAQQAKEATITAAQSVM